jgi:peptidoglycan/xylan/chitin deacetylase (PgdA/CDA1 family)
LRPQIEKHGYRVMTISPENPIAVRDVNSLDYLCVGKATQCPKPSLGESVLKQIAQREKQGVSTHILTFHELSSTVVTLQTLIPELKARGYRFVRLDDYMNALGQRR